MSMNDKISETAIAIASLRALSNYEPDATVQSHDEFAEFFLPEDRQTALKTLNSRENIKQRVPKGMYEYVIARTKYFDSVFVDAIQYPIEQIVLLGAGFDSRSYRFHSRITTTKIFEVDMQPTQDYKLGCLRQHNVAIHPNISFVPMNFETDDPITRLNHYGYDNGKQTLFVWEGVTFYLSRETVTHMLQRLKDHSGAGSRVCFDFQTIQHAHDLIQTGLQEEVIKFGIASGNIVNFVQDHQYRIVEHVTAGDMERRFLTLQHGELFGRIMPMMNILLIEHE